MKTTSRILPMLLLAATTLFTNCGDKNDQPSDGPLKPDDQKAKMEQIGMAFMNEIKPEAMQPAILAINDLLTLLEQEEEVLPVPQMLKRIVERQDLALMAAFAQPNSEAFNIAQYFGVYTYDYDTEKWVRTESNSEIRLVYQSGNKETTLVGTCSSDTYPINMGDSLISIPKSVTFELKKESTQLMKFNVAIPFLSLENYSGSTSASLTVADITLSTEVMFKPTECTLSASMKSKTKNMITFGAKVLATNLVQPNVESWKSVESKLTIMDQCYWFANCPDALAYGQGLAKIETDYERDERNIYGEQYYRDQLDLMNKSFNVFMNYDNSTNKAIKVEMGGQYRYEEFDYGDGNSYHYERMDMMPYLQFADGSKNSAQEFFTEASFANLINSAMQLAQQFATIFGPEIQ